MKQESLTQARIRGWSGAGSRAWGPPFVAGADCGSGVVPRRRHLEGGDHPVPRSRRDPQSCSSGRVRLTLRMPMRCWQLENLVGKELLAIASVGMRVDFM